MRDIRVMRPMRTTTLARCVLVMLAMSAGTVRRGELRDGNGWPTVDALEFHSFPLQIILASFVKSLVLYHQVRSLAYGVKFCSVQWTVPNDQWSCATHGCMIIGRPSPHYVNIWYVELCLRILKIHLSTKNLPGRGNMEDMNLSQEIHCSMIANLTQPVLQMMIHHWQSLGWDTSSTSRQRKSGWLRIISQLDS